MKIPNLIKEAYEKTSRKKVWGLGLTLLTMLTVEIVLTVLIPTWKEGFFNVLQTKNEAQFIPSILIFLGLMLSLGVVQGLKQWIGQLFAFEFRRAISKVLLKKWVYGEKDQENYTEAQTSSLAATTELPVRVSAEILISFFIVIMLIIINIGNPIVVISATLYTIAISIVAKLFNKPLVNTHLDLIECEGKYRESISNIYNGRGDHSSKSKFLSLYKSYHKYVLTRMNFTLFSTVKGSLATLVPYVLMSPQLFKGTITLGEFMAAVSTFELIVINSTIIIQLYPDTTKIMASWKLVNRFYAEVSASEK